MSTGITRTTVNHWTMHCEQQDHGRRTYSITADKHGLHVELNVQPQGLTRHVVTMHPASLILSPEHLTMFQAHVNQGVSAARYFQDIIDAHHEADLKYINAWQQTTT